LILSSSAFQAHAYYHPDEGRWLSRDPIDEPDPIRELVDLQRRQKPALSGSLNLGHESDPALLTDPNLFLFVANDPVNGFDILGLKSDFAKTCPEGWYWGETFGIVPPADGCSTPPLVPTDYDGCDFTPACNNHDYCYSDCDMGRKDCDKNLRNDMKASCDACASKRTFPNDKAKKKWLRACRKWGDIYYAAVRSFGGDPYKNRQESACGCKCDISQFLP
jgi:hypothetical protein